MEQSIHPDSNIYKFPIHPFKRFNKKCVEFKQPVEITCFSYDENRQLHMDDRESRYYYPPNLEDCNLSVGYENLIQKSEGPEPIHSLLDALIHLNETKGDEVKADIVSWRGIFTKLLCTPYNRNESWEFGATLYNVSIVALNYLIILYNTIFIEEHETEQTRLYREGSTPKAKLMGYWGYKFEALCTIGVPATEIQSPDDPELLARKNTIVNTNIQYCSVSKTSLGKNRLIMGAEVDCLIDVKPPYPENPINRYIELKTTKILKNERDNFLFERYKLIKFWAQSFLIGLPKIIVGFRDDDGNLCSLKEIKTLEIPRMVRGKDKMWDAVICLNFLNEFFEWLRRVIDIEDANSSYVISFKEPYQEIEVTFCHNKNPVLADRHLKSFGKK
ncbi:unnamed protein product [Rhizophagus irregularis]|nr:unnamed protein product [Rhizophagus irregularis]